MDYSAAWITTAGQSLKFVIIAIYWHAGDSPILWPLNVQPSNNSDFVY